MTLSTRPSVTPGDDLDGLLRAFYQAQLPRPWPTFKAPPARRAETPPARPARRRLPLLRSRLALAASIALLLLGSLLLPGKAPPAGQAHKALGDRPIITAHKDGPGRKSPPGVEFGPKFRMRESLEQKKDGPTTIKIEVLPETPPTR